MSIEGVDLTVINPTKKVRAKKENTNLTKKQIDTINILVDSINASYLEFRNSLMNLLQVKGRFRIIDDEIELLGSYLLLYFNLETMVVKNKVQLSNSIFGYDDIEPDASYFNRRKKVVREVFGNFLITVDKINNEIFYSDNFLIPDNDDISIIQIDKKNYETFISVMNLLLTFLENEKEKSIIVHKIEKINALGNIKVVLENEIKATRSNGGWLKTLILIKNRERYKIIIDTTASIRMELFSGKEWNYFHHYPTSDYTVCDRFNHSNKPDENTFDKIIEDCINFITDFEDLN